mmetsp:Transcript_14054/g.33527  ORF Transcript_14054/g.33527 Transcript_14054/m.33527 type:complete len:295 (-) Transcript_14054:62-946(-)
MRYHRGLHHMLQRETTHAEVREDRLHAVRSGLESLCARLLVKRKAAKVFAESEEALMIAVLSDGLLETIHINRGVIFVLPNGHIFGDAGHRQLLVSFQPVEAGLCPDGIYELEVTGFLPQKPEARAQVFENISEQKTRSVHEVVTFAVNSCTKTALHSVPQHGIKKRCLPQGTWRCPEESASHVQDQGRSEELTSAGLILLQALCASRTSRNDPSEVWKRPTSSLLPCCNALCQVFVLVIACRPQRLDRRKASAQSRRMAQCNLRGSYEAIKRFLSAAVQSLLYQRVVLVQPWI